MFMNLNIQCDWDAKPFLMDLEIQHYPVKTQQGRNWQSDSETYMEMWKTLIYSNKDCVILMQTEKQLNGIK